MIAATNYFGIILGSGIGGILTIIGATFFIGSQIGGLRAEVRQHGSSLDHLDTCMDGLKATLEKSEQAQDQQIEQLRDRMIRLETRTGNEVPLH